MKRADMIDLATLDILFLEPPANGERELRDEVAAGLALRLRASGARTRVVLTKEGGRRVRRTLGDAALIPLDSARRMAGMLPPSPSPALSAPLHAPDIRVVELMPHFLVTGKRDGGNPLPSARCGAFPPSTFSPIWGSGRCATSPPRTWRAGIST